LNATSCGCDTIVGGQTVNNSPGSVKYVLSKLNFIVFDSVCNVISKQPPCQIV